MLKQSPCRNQRTRGFKVKHAIQICLLISICIWLLYQAKRSHVNNYNGPGERSTKVKESGRRESIKLGRKDIYGGGHGGKEEEMEESKLEETEDEAGRGTGDEEIDGHDQERGEEEEPEEVEDLIDVEDRENEEHLQGKSSLAEDTSLLEVQSRMEGKKSNVEAREERYGSDDVSAGAVQQNMQTISTGSRIQVSTTWKKW